MIIQDVEADANQKITPGQSDSIGLSMQPQGMLLVSMYSKSISCTVAAGLPNIEIALGTWTF